MTEQLKTGTTTLGIVCKDGIVIAADKRATVGHMIYHKEAKKIVPINDQFIVTKAGMAAITDKFIKYITAETQLNNLRLGRPNTVKEVASLTSNLVFNSMQMGGVAHFLLAGRNQDGSVEMYDIFPDGSVEVVKDYWATGSGSVFAQGVIESGYDKEMSITQGITLIKKAFNSAFKNDSASGNGADIYTVTGSAITHAETVLLESKIQV